MTESYILKDGEWTPLTLRINQGGDWVPATASFVTGDGSDELTRRWIDDFERDAVGEGPYYGDDHEANPGEYHYYDETLENDPYREYEPNGILEINEEESYTGTKCLTMLQWPSPIWSLPDYHLLDNYPRPGGTYRVNMRLVNVDYAVEHRVLFGGGTADDWTNPYPRYEVVMKEWKEFFIRLYDESGDTTIIAESNDTGHDGYEYVDSETDTEYGDDGYSHRDAPWYTLIIDWFDEAIDGRTGVKAELYLAEEFDDDEIDATPVKECDSADMPDTIDGSNIMTGPGRWGYDGNATYNTRYDSAEVLEYREE